MTSPRRRRRPPRPLSGFHLSEKHPPPTPPPVDPAPRRLADSPDAAAELERFLVDEVDGSAARAMVVGEVERLMASHPRTSAARIVGRVIAQIRAAQ